MTAQTQSVLAEINKLSATELSELKGELRAQAEAEIVRQVDADVTSGVMPTWTNEESDARARRALSDARTSRHTQGG
jgi:hypothetical protein